MASQYPNNVVTKKGLELIAECIATKKQLIFTKVVAGDGAMPSTNIADMTAVKSPKMELPVTSGVNEGNGQYLISATLSNSALDVGFFPREVGLYAKSESGTEILYSYTNGENNVGYIPDKTSPIESEIYNIRTVIGNAESVTILLKDDTFVTIEDLDAHNKDTNSHSVIINAHNTDITAHPEILKVINTIVGTGAWNKAPSNNIANMITLLGQGGIVSARLASDGFVKFANGFTIQWGISANPTNSLVTVNFPSAFKNQPFIALALGSTSNTDTNHNKPIVAKWESATATSFTFGAPYADTPAVRYVVMGIS